MDRAEHAPAQLEQIVPRLSVHPDITHTMEGLARHALPSPSAKVSQVAMMMTWGTHVKTAKRDIGRGGRTTRTTGPSA